MKHNVLELKNIKALLLDLDGTLINSEKAFCESFKNILKANYGILITSEDYKKYELEKNAMLLEKLRETNSILKNITDEEIMSYIYNDYEKKFRRIILEKESIDNFDILKKLKKLNLTLALVTTCKRYYLNILINELKLEGLFDVIVAREDIENLKPSPDAYLKTMKLLNLNKNECLAFEDSKRGVDSAVDSGIKTIQVSNFTSIKYSDDRTINYNSAKEILNEILKVKRLGN